MNFLNKIFLWITGGQLSSFDQSQISKGTLISIIIQGLSVILVFASNLLWVRLLGAEAYGIFVHIFNWVAILSIVALGGKEDLVLAEIPRHNEKNNGSVIRFLINYANKWTLLRSFFLTLLFLLLIFFIPIRSLTEYRNYFLIAAVAIFFSAFINLNQLVLQSLHKIKMSQITDRILKPLLLIVAGLFFFTSGLNTDARTIILTNVVVLAICSLILFMIIRRFYKTEALEHGQNISAEIRKKTAFFFMISLLYMLSTRLHMLALSYYNPGADTGIFNICYRFAELLIFPYYILHFVLPQLFSRNTFSGVTYNQSLFSAATRFMLLLTVPLLIIVVLFGKFFLGWFGEEFTAGYNCLVYLSVSQSLFAFAGPCNTILMTQNKEKFAAIALLVYCFSLLVTNFSFIPEMGITGAGLASLISSFIYHLLLILFTYRHSRVLTPLFKIRSNPNSSASSQ